MDSKSIQHYQLESGIHQFIFLESTADAAKSYTKQYTQLFQSKKVKSGDPLPIYRLLLDFRHADFPPLHHVVAENVQGRHHRQTTGIQVIWFVAYLSDDKNLGHKFHLLSPLLLEESRRAFFKSNEVDQAIQWLLKQTPQE